MRIYYSDTHLSVTQASSVQVAGIVGIEYREGVREFHLDRKLSINPQQLPDEWNESGVITTILQKRIPNDKG